MPLYDFACPNCNMRDEFYVVDLDEIMTCSCGTDMERRFPGNQMVKMKGGGGYPSRQKQYRNTSKRIHPNLT